MSFPFFGQEFTFTQPDGTKVRVRGLGDQHRAVFETMEGFMVIRDTLGQKREEAMFKNCLCIIGLVLLVLAGPQITIAASPKAGADSQTTGDSTSSLSGFSYYCQDWSEWLYLPTTKDGDRRVLCYKLLYTDSVLQPFILEPTPKIDLPCKDYQQDTIAKKQCDGQKEPNATWNPCTTLDEDHPLLMEQQLIIGLDATNLSKDFEKSPSPLGLLKILNINVTTQQGIPINPTPIRPTFPLAPVSGTKEMLRPPKVPPPIGCTKTANKPYFMVWPYRLAADTIPTVSVKAIYSPPAVGPFNENLFYPSGSIIISMDTSPPKYLAAPVSGLTKTVDFVEITSPPSGVSFGVSEQNVNLLNTTLPQVHALSYFNVAFGLVYNFIRNPTYGNTTANPVETSNSGLYDPVLMLTVYPHPIDAERKWQCSDLIPGISMGLSLASPKNNFYIGGSSEFFIRNIQLTYGLAIVTNYTSLVSPQPSSASSTGAPVTTTKIKYGEYIGFTFNVGGFIQSVFGGGGK